MQAFDVLGRHLLGEGDPSSLPTYRRADHGTGGDEGAVQQALTASRDGDRLAIYSAPLDLNGLLAEA